MDLNYLREAALILFGSAMLIEAWVTFEMFFDQDSLPVPKLLKWATSICLVLFSGVNLYAFQEVFFNTALTNPLITKMLYCTAGLMVMGCLHYLNSWAKSYLKELDIE